MLSFLGSLAGRCRLALNQLPRCFQVSRFRLALPDAHPQGEFPVQLRMRQIHLAAAIERMHQLRNTTADSAAKLHANAQKLAENTSRIVASMHVIEGKQKKRSLKASAQPAI